MACVSVISTGFSDPYVGARVSRDGSSWLSSYVVRPYCMHSRIRSGVLIFVSAVTNADFRLFLFAFVLGSWHVNKCVMVSL